MSRYEDHERRQRISRAAVNPDIQQFMVEDDEQQPQRSESMVRRASEWAQSILSSPQSAPIGRGSRKSRRATHPVSIPVNETICVIQPSGESSLAVSVGRLKDAMVQVNEDDLYAELGITKEKGSGRLSRTTSLDSYQPYRPSRPDPTMVHLGRLSLASNVETQIETDGETAPKAATPQGILTDQEHVCDDDDEEEMDDLSALAESSSDALKKRKHRKRRRKKRMIDAACQTDNFDHP